MMSAGVISWWILLCVVGAFNIVAWSLSARQLHRRRQYLPAQEYVLRKRLLCFAALYVFGCAYRSAFPVFDVPRIVLVNSFLSSVAVGRAVATVAELAFVVQWALLLREAARATASRVAKFTALALVPLIAIAECCSWYSVLTTSNLGHTAEESLWTLGAAALVVSLLVIWRRGAATQRPVIAACCVAAVGYLCFMVLIDVPMYAARWVADGRGGRHLLTIAEGFKDVATRWSVSYRWQDWRTEVVWMALYFSVCVWISISLVHAPVFGARIATAERKRWTGSRSVFAQVPPRLEKENF